ncbi:MAG: hypothetical protein WC557_06930 [Ignavibacteriaceae bacterium]
MPIGNNKTYDTQPKVFPLFPSVSRSVDRLGFDIYDYEFLFQDKKTVELIREGNTIGCFYIESPGMRSLLRRLDVDNYELLVAASSVIRPGVAESGMMDEFILRHHHPERRTYLLPELKKYLGETYGVMIYQEDVLKVAHHIVGLTLDEADFLRRAMSGKMRSHKAMEMIRERFFTSCKKKNYSDFVANELWRQIESFAGYAFCKAHSASFALLSYQVAFLKAHYPAEFLASVLSNRGGYYAAAVYVQEAKRLGIEVKLPSINESEYEYTGTQKIIRIGFLAIKNFSRESANKIVEERNRAGSYSSLFNFFMRTRIGYEEMKSLIRCGAMDCFAKNRPGLLRELDVHLQKYKFENESFFADELEQYLGESLICPVDYSIEEKCAIEYETFGFMVTKHPLEFIPELSNHKAVIKAAEMKNYNGKQVRMIGWFMTSKRIKTKKGEIMKFLSLEDLSGTFEAVIFPKTYTQYAEKTFSMGPYFLLGKVEMKNGNTIIVEKLEVLTNAKVKALLQKDSTENKYYGDEDSVTAEDVLTLTTLDHEKLKRAYLG